MLSVDALLGAWLLLVVCPLLGAWLLLGVCALRIACSLYDSSTCCHTSYDCSTSEYCSSTSERSHSCAVLIAITLLDVDTLLRSLVWITINAVALLNILTLLSIVGL